MRREPGLSNACVDASVGVKWVLPEQHSQTALRLYADCRQLNTTIAAPPHFPVEVTNAIRRRVARRLVTHEEARVLLATFSQFSVRLAIPGSLYQEALDLADTFNRPTVYDTHYVALAKILGCDLWTADETLLNVLGNNAPWVRFIGDYRP